MPNSSWVPSALCHLFSEHGSLKCKRYWIDLKDSLHDCDCLVFKTSTRDPAGSPVFKIRHTG